MELAMTDLSQCEDWLLEQLAMLRAWRDSAADDHEAESIARHEHWLATRLSDLTGRRHAA